jgi:hypothetical protein
MILIKTMMIMGTEHPNCSWKHICDYQKNTFLSVARLEKTSGQQGMVISSQSEVPNSHSTLQRPNHWPIVTGHGITLHPLEEKNMPNPR